MAAALQPTVYLASIKPNKGSTIAKNSPTGIVTAPEASGRLCLWEC